MLKRIFRRCICCVGILTIIITFFGGLYLGFRMGKDYVCGDIAFYYNNDLPVKACVAKNDNKLTINKMGE